MRTFSTNTAINAPAERIWALLTDAKGWLGWNSTVVKIEGSITAGGRVKVWPKLSPERAFPLRVTEYVPNRKMVWSGGMPFGLFKGVRTYTLTPGTTGAVEFAMREEYFGPMAGLITRSIPDLQPAFDQFARDLKRAAEAAR